MRILVGIPWRPGDPERRRNYKHVHAHLSATLPDAEIRTFDTGHEVFNRAAARNAAARFALDNGHDVLVLSDADTLAQAEPLRAAVETCHDGRMHLPYDFYRGLTARGTRRYLAGQPQDVCPAEHEHPWATGGVMVCQPAAWFQAGGMDERFEGWGFEDTAARLCWDALLGETVRHEGLLLHLWHPLESNLGSPRWWGNKALMDAYEAAEGDAERILGVIAGRPGGDRSPGIPSNTPP